MSPAGDKPKTEPEARGRLKSAPRKESSKSNAASSLREIAERFERDLSHWETFLPDAVAEQPGIGSTANSDACDALTRHVASL